MDGASSLSLFSLFIQGFNVDYIYEQGWKAADQWMMLVSGILMAIAISIRSAEEHVNTLKGGQSGFNRFVIDTIIIGASVALYFTIAWLIIDVFNGIYGILSNDPMVQMTKKLESIMKELQKKDYEFSLSDIGDSIFSAFAYIAYWLTHMILVCIALAMKIAHAVLVSFCLFYGAIALPISITKGLKQLAGFRNLCVMVLLWPIIDRFFMFLIGGSFMQMLSGSALEASNFETWNMGVLVFYFTAFSIINILLAASLVSAPFVAQGMANNSGNVSGMVGSFAAAGVAAGTVAAKSFLPKKDGLADKGARKMMDAGSSKLSGNPVKSGSFKESAATLAGSAALAGGGAAFSGAKSLASNAMEKIQSIGASDQPKNFSSGVGVGLSKGITSPSVNTKSPAKHVNGGSFNTHSKPNGSGTSHNSAQQKSGSTGPSSTSHKNIAENQPNDMSGPRGSGSGSTLADSTSKGSVDSGTSNTAGSASLGSTSNTSSSKNVAGSTNDNDTDKSEDDSKLLNGADPNNDEAKLAGAERKKGSYTNTAAAKAAGIASTAAGAGAGTAQESSLSDDTLQSEQPKENITEQERKKKRRDGRAGYFANKNKAAQNKRTDK